MPLRRWGASIRNSIVYIMLVIVVGQLVIIVALGNKVNNLEGQGFRNAAKQCSLAIADNVPLTDDCENPAVREFYDPNKIPRAATKEQLATAADRNARLQCETIRATGRDNADCVGLLGPASGTTTTTVR